MQGLAGRHLRAKTELAVSIRAPGKHLRELLWLRALIFVVPRRFGLGVGTIRTASDDFLVHILISARYSLGVIVIVLVLVTYVGSQ